MLGISIISNLVTRNHITVKIFKTITTLKGKITWNKPSELDSLDFGNPGPESRKDNHPSQAPVKNKLTSTITQLIKDHFEKKNNHENAKNIHEKVASTNGTIFSLDAIDYEYVTAYLLHGI